MNWDAIGAIAELLGSVAVVITLLFLAAQLRSNSAMLRNSSMQSQAAAMTGWAANLAGDPELYSLYRKGLIDDASLSKEELGRFDLVLVQVFQSVSAIHRQYVNGGMDDATWEANLLTLGASFNTPGGRASWERQKYMLDDRFRDEVEAYFSDAKVYGRESGSKL